MKKTAAVIFYIIGSIVWLYFAVLCLSAMWRESTSGGEWNTKLVMAAAGGIMFLAWILRTVMMLLKYRVRQQTQKKPPLPEPGTGEKHEGC